MNDYLSNLVAKSLGLADVLLPRPVSLFEPLQPSRALGPDNHYSLEQDIEESRRRVNVRPLTDEAAAPTPKAESSEKPFFPHNPEIESLTPRPALVLDNKPSESTPLLILNRTAISERGGADGNRQAVRSASTVRDDDPSQVAVQSTVPSDRLKGAQEATSAATLPKTEREMVVPESIERALPLRTLLIAPGSTPNQVIFPERESSSPERAERIRISGTVQHETAPTIKITIGRVDVRAVMPERPAANPVPEPRNLALSLEEYLKQRSGGKP